MAPVEDHLILPARVGLHAGEEYTRRQMGQEVPSPVSIRLLIDTGAKRTTLVPEVIRTLGAFEGRTVQVVTPLGAGATTLYWVRLDFPGTALSPFEYAQVASLEMPPGLRQLHGLLGRDLLSRWDALLYEGRRGRYVIRDTPGLFSWLRRWL